VAAAIVSAPTADAVTAGARTSVSERAALARAWMEQRLPAQGGSPSQQPDELAWIRWGNLIHPGWNNWPNWHNWNNWPNWPNY